MGTRGFITFVADKQEKTAYNHWDSYPEGKGVQILAWLRKAAEHPAALREAAKRLRVVSPQSMPTTEDIGQLMRFADTSVSTGNLGEWYVLLRHTQGDPGAMLDAGVIEDASEFPLDSLFAEYGYVIDLDGDGLFEVYRGFQKEPHDKGRFARRTSYLDYQCASENKRMMTGLYYPVALAARWPLADLPTEADFLEALKEVDDDDE